MIDHATPQDRLTNCHKLVLAKLWMTENGCCLLTNPNFHPTTAEYTNVRATFIKKGFVYKNLPLIDELELEARR
jgi:hypothetical protein